MATLVNKKSPDPDIADSSLTVTDFVQPPRISKFKIALCQLTVTSDKDTNITNARRKIDLAAEHGAKLVVLPEMWSCPYSSDNFAQYVEDFSDVNDCPSISMLAEAAHFHGITIVGGSVPERDRNKLYNTCCVLGPAGNLIAKHKKMHLFDVDIAGDISFKESDTLRAGQTATIVDTEVGRIGIGICHDIRFPELAMLYRARGADLICYPGAFNMSTGEMLWELVQRARAADNQLYVATCSPSRDSTGCYTIWGHSTLVGPCGEIIATSDHEEGLVVAEVDYSTAQLQREIIPLSKLRRPEIYGLVEPAQDRRVSGRIYTGWMMDETRSSKKLV